MMVWPGGSACRNLTLRRRLDDRTGFLRGKWVSEAIGRSFVLFSTR